MTRISPAAIQRLRIRLMFPLVLMLMVLQAYVVPVGHAQTAATGALGGTVSDTTGAVLPGVEIQVVNDSNGTVRRVASQNDGSYLVPLLDPGIHRLLAKHSGFKEVTVTAIQINVTQRSRIDIQMQVGATEQSVTVAGQEMLVQTDSSALGQVVESKMVDELPLVTRNFTQIIGLSTGITTNVTNATELGRGSGGVASTSGGVFVRGGRSYDNNFQMDGVAVNDVLTSSSKSTAGLPIPNPDTIQEFKVQTGQYDATFGPNSGANVNIVTKSGSNLFHGSAFEFFRNRVLNANDFFFDRTGQKKPDLNQNQFGMTLGGPIRKDSLLFFGSYQGTRQKNGFSSQGTEKCRDSAFSPPFTNDRSAGALGQMFAGQRGVFQNAFGGVGPAILADGSNIDPAALAILQFKMPDGSYLIPTPTVIDPSQPFNLQGFTAISLPCSFDEDQYLGNVDFIQSDKTTWSARSFFVDSVKNVTLPAPSIGNASGNVPGFPLLDKERIQYVSLAHKHIFSASKLNEARFGYLHQNARGDQKSPFKWTDVGVNAPPQANDNPVLNITGSFELGGSLAVTTDQQIFSAQDLFSWTKGKHLIRFGGGFEHSAIESPKNLQVNGFLLFLSWPDLLLGLDGADNGTGVFSNVFASIDFTGQADRQLEAWNGSLFLQDDWRVFPRLTFNLGLRYDRIGNYAETQGRGSNVLPNLIDPNPPATGSLAGFVVPSNFKGAVPSGVTVVSRSYGLKGDDQNVFGPRFGFAWQILPNSPRFVLRGGYGIYYTRAAGQPLNANFLSPPFSQFRVSVGAPNAAATLGNPFAPAPLESSFPIFPPYSPNTALTPTVVDQNFRPPMIQEYSLNVQTAITNDLLWEVGYVGTRSTHLVRARNVNQALSATSGDPIRGATDNTIANIPLRVPYEGFGQFTEIESAGFSWYNGLETTVKKRFSHGLQLLTSYTFSKSLDSDGANVVLAAAGFPTAGDQNNPKSRYGRPNFDRTHRLVISFTYDFPHFAQREGILPWVVNGWSIAGVTTIQSGQALSMLSTNATNVFGVTQSLSDQAQLAPGCNNGQLVTKGSVDSKLSNYFNKSCFAPFPIIGADGVGTNFGNSGVGIVNGPDQRNFDLSFAKQTPLRLLGEQSNVEFRADLFNAFNTPQFANPSTDFSAASFGTITSTVVGPRVIQLGLKINF